MKEEKLLELTSDVVFKAFMMSDNTKKYKARLIHLITGIDEEELLKAKYVSKEFPVSHKKDKVYKSDIIATVGNNIINLEMNEFYYRGLFEKNNTYANKARSESFESGDNYLDIERVIQINVDDFCHFKIEKLIYKFMMREIEIGEIECENVESYHVNLGYLNKSCYNKEEEIVELLKLFKIQNKEEVQKLRGEELMEDAINELERISKDEKIIGLYDAEKVEAKVRNTQIEGARRDGIEEGLAQGLEQGARNEKIEIAKNLLKENIDIQTIINATGLSKNEIDSLKNT